jgi:hypothetical protein
MTALMRDAAVGARPRQLLVWLAAPEHKRPLSFRGLLTPTASASQGRPTRRRSSSCALRADNAAALARSQRDFRQVMGAVWPRVELPF